MKRDHRLKQQIYDKVRKKRFLISMNQWVVVPSSTGDKQFDNQSDNGLVPLKEPTQLNNSLTTWTSRTANVNRMNGRRNNTEATPY